MTTSSKITENWIRLIQYARGVVPYGELTIEIVAGEPLTLISAKRKIRFDKPDTLPPSLPTINEDN